MYCKNCGKEINQEDTFCKGCGAPSVQQTQQAGNFSTAPSQGSIPFAQSAKRKKKSPLKLIIIIAAAIFALILIIAMAGGDETEPANNESTSQHNSVTTSSAATTNAAPDTSMSEFYKSFETANGGSIDYTLSKKSIDYINAHNNYFPCRTNEAYSEMSFEAVIPSFAEIEKSPSKYHEKISYFISMEVLEIRESDDGEYTYLHLLDEDWNSFVGIIYGTLPDIFKEDIVDVYGLPVDLIYFENQNGGTTEAVFLAISACGKDSVWSFADTPAGEEDPVLENNLRTDPLGYFRKRYSDHYGTELIPDMYQVSTMTGDVLNVRSSWSADSGVITTLQDGYYVSVYGTYKNWAYIQPENAPVYGWVSMDYLSMPY